MVITFKHGKIIVTPNELVIKLTGDAHIMMQASAETVELIGQGVNVIAVNSGAVRWSVKLDNGEQMIAIADVLGCDVT
jgi:hypothetical protein